MLHHQHLGCLLLSWFGDAPVLCRLLRLVDATICAFEYDPLIT